MCTSLPALSLFDVFGQIFSIFPPKLRLLGTGASLYQGKTLYFDSFGCWEPLQRNTFLLFSSVYLLALPYFVLCL